MKISVIGTGYVGLTTGIGLATYGHEVTCIDIDAEKILKLQSGIISFYEPDLDKYINQDNLKFTTEIPDNADVIFLAIGTPSCVDGNADLQNLFNAVADVSIKIKKYTVIVNKSTCPVGTCNLIKKTIQGLADVPFDIVSNPEFLKEGSALHDFLYPDRIIIGCENLKAFIEMNEVYEKSCCKNIIPMDILSAELTKYAANSMLTTRISFMNELSLLCDKIGADIKQVKKGIGSDSRIGDKFLNAGIGYGGSCFPKDIDALLHTFYKNGINNKILKAVKDVNYEQPKYFLDKIYDHFQGMNKNLKVAIWGLAFKPDTDDIRCAPAIKIIEELLFFHCEIIVYDPVVKDIGINGISHAKRSIDCLIEADCLLVLTEWDEFKCINFETVKLINKNLVIFDGRNIYDKKEMEKLGFIYYGIGV